MEKTLITFSIIGGIALTYLIVIIFIIISRKRTLESIERSIIELYGNKINKLPALVEIMRLHTAHGDICTEMVRLHRATIITRQESIYDILELNNRIQREFGFLMKVSAKIKDLHKNGNFLYIRDFMTFYELSINRLILEYNTEVESYNRAVIYKNFSILWLFLPISKKIVI